MWIWQQLSQCISFISFDRPILQVRDLLKFYSSNAPSSWQQGYRNEFFLMLSRPTSLLKEPGTGKQINRSISWLPLGIPSCCPGFPMDMPGVHTWWYMAEEEHNLKKPTYSHLCTLNTEQMDQEPQTEVVLPKILSKIPWVRSPWNPLLCVQTFLQTICHQ